MGLIKLDEKYASQMEKMMNTTEKLNEIPYWLDPPPLAKSYSAKPLPEKTDILVVGGGYTGMTAAIRLRQAGARVTVVDQERLATTASARNGGMTLTGLSDGVSKFIKKLGIEKTRQLFAESLETVACVERLVQEGHIDCHFNRYGHLEAAFKPSHYEGLKRTRELLSSRFGHTTRLIPAAQLNSEIGSDLYHGGLLDPLSAGLHPGRYIAGLIKMADQLGVDLHEEVEAESVAHNANAFSITTNRGSIRAVDVIVATNGYTGRFTPWLQRRVLPAYSVMIATEELPHALARSLIPKGRMVFDTKNLLYYFRLSPDGKRLLFGGRRKSLRKSLRENAVYLHQDMLRVYPQLKECRIEYAWWGKVAITQDRLPHIGRLDGMYYALGYCGHGVALATYLGEKLAAMISGKETNTAFADQDCKAIPFYGGNPWFMPFIYYYLSVLDRIT